MRRTLFVGALTFVALFVVALEAGDLLFVQVRDTELRSGPGFLSPIQERLGFGAEVAYVGERSGWMEVTVAESGVTGWVHATAVEENRSTQMALRGAQTTRTVTSREVALAGRGFSENLEDEYRGQHQLDFEPIDELEQEQVDPGSIVSFIREAGLREDFLTEAE